MIQFNLMRAALAAFFFFALFSSLLFASDTPQVDREWLNLLHFKSQTSNLDGPLFFLAEDGKNNAQKELLSNIELLPQKNITGGHFKQPLYCVFPARVMYLKKRGLWHGPDIQDCPDFYQWKKGMAGDHAKIYLTFSTSFPNNPASTFGHTFLRIQKGEGPNDLLDYTVAINAEVPPDTNQVAYALKGLFGFFKTFIDVAPFFQKIQEYNNAENRDLYEYQLNFTSREIDILLAHIWEIYSSSWFDYYFLDENCSSFLAEILQAARPLPLIHNRFYYLPSDLVKLALKENLIEKEKAPIFRPGAKKKWKYLYNHLKHSEKKAYQSLLAEGLESSDVNVLDTALLEYNIKQHQTSNLLSEKERYNFRQILLWRSKIKEIAETVAISNDNRPEFAHSPSKIILQSSLFKNNHKSEVVNSFQLKLGHHDELDNPKGFEPFSRFDFFSFSFSHYTLQHKFKLSEIKGIAIYSATPLSRTHRQLSWQVQGGIAPALDSPCSNCLSSQIKGLGGTAFSFNHQDSWMIVPMLGAFMSTGGRKTYLKGFRIGPILELAEWGRLGPIMLGLKENLYRDYYAEKINWFKFSAELNFPFSKEQEIRLEWNSFYKNEHSFWQNHSEVLALSFGMHY